MRTTHAKMNTSYKSLKYCMHWEITAEKNKGPENVKHPLSTGDEKAAPHVELG